MSERSLTAALTLLAILMVAGLVHIASLLLMPLVAPDNAYARLSALVPEGRLATLPRTTLNVAALPDRDPSVATAVCRYDLAAGPLRVGAALGSGSFLAVSLYTRSGIAFYGLDDRAGNDGRLELVVMTSSQREAAEAHDTTDAPLRDVRVTAPERRGFVTFDVIPRVGGYAAAVRDLTSMRCGVEHSF